MELADFTKDVRTLLLQHWTRNELKSRLMDPSYFFEQVVVPHLDFLRRSGQEVPRLRIKSTPTGDLRIILNN